MGFMQIVRCDAYRYSESGNGGMLAAMKTPGFVACLLYRAGHHCLKNGVPVLPGMFRWLGLMLTGTDISPNAIIGQGLLVAHPQGIVIGSGVRMARAAPCSAAWSWAATWIPMGFPESETRLTSTLEPWFLGTW